MPNYDSSLAEKTGMQLFSSIRAWMSNYVQQEIVEINYSSMFCVP